MNLVSILLLVSIISVIFADQPKQARATLNIQLGDTKQQRAQDYPANRRTSHANHDEEEEPFDIRRTYSAKSELLNRVDRYEEDESDEDDYERDDYERDNIRTGVAGASVMVGRSVGDAVETAADSSKEVVHDMTAALSDSAEALAANSDDFDDDVSDGMKDVVDGLTNMVEDAAGSLARIAGRDSRRAVEDAVENTGKVAREVIDSAFDAKKDILRALVDAVHDLHHSSRSAGHFLQSSGESVANIIDTLSRTFARVQRSALRVASSATDNQGDFWSILPRNLGNLLSDFASATNSDESADMIDDASDSVEKVFKSNVLGNAIRALDGRTFVTIYEADDDETPEVLPLSQDEATLESELEEMAKIGELRQESKNGWILVMNAKGENQYDDNRFGENEYRRNGRRYRGGSGFFGRRRYRDDDDEDDDDYGYVDGMRSIFRGLVKPFDRITNGGWDDDSDYRETGRWGGRDRRYRGGRRYRGQYASRYDDKYGNRYEKRHNNRYDDNGRNTDDFRHRIDGLSDVNVGINSPTGGLRINGEVEIGQRLNGQENGRRSTSNTGRVNEKPQYAPVKSIQKTVQFVPIQYVPVQSSTNSQPKTSGQQPAVKVWSNSPQVVIVDRQPNYQNRENAPIAHRLNPDVKSNAVKTEIGQPGHREFSGDDDIALASRREHQQPQRHQHKGQPQRDEQPQQKSAGSPSHKREPVEPDASVSIRTGNSAGAVDSGARSVPGDKQPEVSKISEPNASANIKLNSGDKQ